ncbi:uncharacterized protein LOC117181086 [Belonocnema kinseyi]|uniref:uncharacterized protein LOC117181086 n=1 Tax=Belonocnema kinseyi TaxID=2817044 RepID=UPI00143D8EA9|nr:uncharacterized protein LOC117181086 [Belonocnema kinseyi]
MNNPELDALRASRTPIKAKLTRNKNFLEKIKHKSHGITTLAEKLEKFNPLYSEFDSVQTQIEILLGEDEQMLEEQSKQRDDFETDYFTALSEARAILEENRTTPVPWLREIVRKTHLACNGKKTCPLCGDSHGLYNCERLRALPVSSRIKEVRRLRICYNCLSPGHHNRQCNAGPCTKCKRKHNTLLHLETSVAENANKQQSIAVVQNLTSKGDQPIKTTLVAHSRCMDNEHVILGTALVWTKDRRGKLHECRVLLDSCSQVNLMTREFCKKLELPMLTSDTVVSGVFKHEQEPQHRAHFTFNSRCTDLSQQITCLITTDITDDMPNVRLRRSDFSIPDGITMADPRLAETRPIDLLIGGGTFWKLLCVGQIQLREDKIKDLSQDHPKSISDVQSKGRTLFLYEYYGRAGSPWSIRAVDHLPKLRRSRSGMWFGEVVGQIQLREDKTILQKTQLGWIVAGSMELPPPSYKSQAVCNLISNQQLHNEVQRFWGIEHYSVKRDQPELDLRDVCEQHFLSTTKRDPEGRFIVTIPFKDEVNVLGDSLKIAEKRLFAMELFKEGSTTTKLRVVFDGSAKTSSGLSLNEVQRVGPVVQNDLFPITLRFRQYPIVLSADIAQMYRQIKVTQSQQNLQRIVWRTDASKPIQHFRLTTVTYGTASAPFLASRALRQIGEENKENYPSASQVVMRDFYVDDLLTGANTVEEARKLKTEIIHLLSAAGMDVQKWASNNPYVFEESNHSKSERMIQTDKDPKTVGLLWTLAIDELKYCVQQTSHSCATKRPILSTIAQIFDPLGLVVPAVIRAKIILQSLWQLKLGWDETLPQNLHTVWKEFHGQRKALNEISVPRFVLGENLVTVQLHGFSDASTVAYGACIYLRSSDSVGNRTVHNPADLISRGINPEDLCDQELWWKDPDWLSQSVENWPAKRDLTSEELDKLPEAQKRKANLLLTAQPDFTLLERYSSLHRLIRVTAYCLRFIENVKRAKELQKLGYLEVSERAHALSRLLKLAQTQDFLREIRDIQESKQISNKSRLYSLNPFLDAHGLLRVGGRLVNAPLSFEQKHPIILSPSNPLTILIISNEHLKLMHGRCQAVMASLRNEYWPISCKNTIKNVLRKCVTCFE